MKNLLGKKRARNAAKDAYYLREAFGPVCPELAIKNEKISEKKGKTSKKGKKRPAVKPPKRIEATYFEWVTTAQVSTMITDQMGSKGLKGKTANRFREVLVRLYNWAATEGGVTMPGNRNPAAKVKRYEEDKPAIRFLKLEEINTQLKALAHLPVLLIMVAIYIYAGLRREELLWLTLDDVDLKTGRHGVIRVQAKEIDGEFWQPKTGKDRVVPISKTLRRYLDTYVPKKVAGKWYFSTPEGKRWDPDNFSQFLRETNKKAGLVWACLDFRHTFGSHLAMKGESLYKISKLMGNSPEICQKHYAHLTPESLLDSVEFGADDASPPLPTAPPTAVPTTERKGEKPGLRLVVNNT